MACARSSVYFDSLNSTCFLTLGSYFLNSRRSGVVRLFFVVWYV